MRGCYPLRTPLPPPPPREGGSTEGPLPSPGTSFPDTHEAPRSQGLVGSAGLIVVRGRMAVAVPPEEEKNQHVSMTTLRFLSIVWDPCLHSQILNEAGV